MAIGFGSSSSINGLDETLECESLTLSYVHSIEDEALKFCHIVHEEEALRNRVRPIVNQRLRCRHTSTKVHRVYLILANITLQMNG